MLFGRIVLSVNATNWNQNFSKNTEKVYGRKDRRTVHQTHGNFWSNWRFIRHKKTANYDGFYGDYELKLFDILTEMRNALRIKNVENNKSRITAGYYYKWKTKNSPNSQGLNFVIVWKKVRKPYISKTFSSDGVHKKLPNLVSMVR